MKVTVVVDPGTPRQTEHVAQGPSLTIGTREGADVVVAGPGVHRVVVHAGDGLVEATGSDGVVIAGETLPRMETRWLRRDDLLRLGPDGPTLRIDVGLLALAWPVAVFRGLVVGGLLAALTLVLAVLTLNAHALAAAVMLLEVGLVIALATLVELGVSRAGPTWRRRVAAVVANAALATLAFAAASVNQDYMASALTDGPAAATAAAADALAGLGALPVAHRHLTLGLVVGLVTDLRWWNLHALVTLAVAGLGSGLVFFLAAFAADALDLPPQAGSARFASGMETAGYGMTTLLLAFLLAIVLHLLQRFGRGAERT